MGPTWPNRFYLHAATADGHKTNLPMGLSPPPTIWERHGRPLLDRQELLLEQAALVLAGVPGQELLGRRRDHARRRSTTSIADAAAGSLPNLAIIDPDFEANDGHPPHDLALCEAFVASVYRALAESPQWSRSLLVVIFDEHGGFFDHVRAAADRRSGSRVPPARASACRRSSSGPLVRRGAVVSTPFEHVSIAATLKTRFGIASLGRRMDAANDLSSCLDPERRRRTPRAVAADGRAQRIAHAARAAARDQPAGDARAGGMPAASPTGTVDPRSGEERVKAWLRHAQALEVDPGDRVIAWLTLALSLTAAEPAGAAATLRAADVPSGDAPRSPTRRSPSRRRRRRR